MKKTITLLLAALLCLLPVMGGCATTETVETTKAPEVVATAQPEPEDAPAKYNAGTYTATAMGNNGDVTVSVTFTENEIASVVIAEHAETVGISDAAIERIPKGIVDGQTLAVDAISGATNTSKAILSAVEDCVVQAGGDVEALKAASQEVEQNSESVELTADVVIVGAGGAGMSAAVSALDAGASVIILEKTAATGGSTSLSGGLVNAAGTTYQIAQGIVGDTIETHIADTWNRGDQKGNLALVTLLCNEVKPTMEWLSAMGLVWSDEVQEKPDCTYIRSHTPVRPEGYEGKLGWIITDLLAQQMVEKGAQLLLETPVDGIIVEDGKTVGVTAKGADGTTYTVYGKSVVLTAGGFGANGEMVHQYDPNIPADCANSVHAGATGEVLIMAQGIGANVVDMGYVKSLLYSKGATTAFKDAIMVNTDGNRFTDELAKAEVLNAALMEQSSKAFMVYDAEVVGEVNDKITKKLADGDLFCADTVEELAAVIGVDAANLAAAVEGYNACVAGTATDELGRTKFGSAIDVGPFYAAVPYVQVAYTNGGVEIDESMHVISTEGAILEGLFAAGEITGGVHGSYRVGGNAVAESLTFGRLAGENAAAYALN